jgi:hypothetical protein
MEKRCLLISYRFYYLPSPYYLLFYGGYYIINNPLILGKRECEDERISLKYILNVYGKVVMKPIKIVR